MMHRVYVLFGCGYAEIARRRSISAAVAVAREYLTQYGPEIAPLIDGRPLTAYDGPAPSPSRFA